jgi:hypothetical protein
VCLTFNLEPPVFLPIERWSSHLSIDLDPVQILEISHRAGLCLAEKKRVKALISIKHECNKDKVDRK